MADMKKFEELKNRTVDNGGYFVHFYFDMHSSDKENLQNIMVGFVSKITKEPGVNMAVAEIDEPIENDKEYSTTSKVSMLIASFSDLVRITQSYTPIGIEVEEPLDAKIDAGELQVALMGISTTNQELTQYILTKTMNDEQRKKLAKHMSARAQLGKKVREEIGRNKKEDKKGE